MLYFTLISFAIEKKTVQKHLILVLVILQILTCQPITDSFLFSSRNKTASLYSSRGEQSLRDLEKFSVSTNDLSSLKLTDKPNTRSITPDPKGSNESSFSRFKCK